MALESNASLKEVIDTFEQIDDDLQLIKNDISNSIKNKGVVSSGTDGFDKMCSDIDNIKTDITLVASNNILFSTSGKTYTNYNTASPGHSTFRKIVGGRFNCYGSCRFITDVGTSNGRLTLRAMLYLPDGTSIKKWERTSPLEYVKITFDVDGLVPGCSLFLEGSLDVSSGYECKYSFLDICADEVNVIKKDVGKYD